MHSVDEIHVQMPWWAEHHGVASGAAPVGVRSGLVGTAIGLELDEADRYLSIPAVGDHLTAQQQAGGRQHVDGQPLTGERRHGHAVTQAQCSPAACRARCSCSATRSGAVPPYASRELIEPATLSTRRTSTLSSGWTAASSISDSSDSPTPRDSASRTQAPAAWC